MMMRPGEEKKGAVAIRFLVLTFLPSHVLYEEAELAEIRELTGDEIKLATQNQRLESEVQQLLLQLDWLQS